MTTDSRAITPSDVGVAGITMPDLGEAATALEHILGTGDLSQLSSSQRVHHYLHLCRSLGLNPASRPFDWIEFYDPETRGKKLTLYLNQSGASQLRRIHQISAHFTRREQAGDLFVVEAEGRTPDGRTATASKYVPITGQDGKALIGQRRANALMKCETGALRRLTLAMVGLTSGPDTDEAEDARMVVVDGNGEVIRHPSRAQRAVAADPGMARVLGEPRYEDHDTGDSLLAGGFAGTVSQAPTPEDLEPKKRPIDRQSFKPSDEDVKRWLGAWFAAVKGTDLDSDDERHQFMREYTMSFPLGLQTDSLRSFFEHATERQAGDLLATTRRVVDLEREEAAELGAEAQRMAAEDGDEEAF